MIAGLGTLCKCKLLEQCRNTLNRVVTAVVVDIRIGIHYFRYVFGGIELVLQFNQLILCVFIISIRRNDVKHQVLDSTVRSLFVQLFVLVVQFLDIALFHLYQAVRNHEVRLHHILCGNAVLTTVESVLSIQAVVGNQVLQQRVVFLLHVRHAKHGLQVVPVFANALEISVLLRVAAAFCQHVNYVLHDLAIELTVLVCKSTTTSDDLVDMVTGTQIGQLILSDRQTNLVCLLTHGVIHYECIPYLITDLSVSVFVKIAATILHLVHFCQLIFSSLVLGDVNSVTFNNTNGLRIISENEVLDKTGVG